MKSLKSIIFNIFKYNPNKEYNFILPENKVQSTNNLEPLDDIEKPISADISDNLNFIKKIYHYPANSDIKIREFKLNIQNEIYNAFIVYIDGMVNNISINQFVLQPLMLKNKSNSFISDNINTADDISNHIYNSLIPENDVQKKSNFKEIFPAINFGSCAIFIDKIDESFVIDVKGFSTRSIAPPKNEAVIKGPQEAFIENIRTNTTLLRRGVNNENLIIENIDIGSVSRN